MRLPNESRASALKVTDVPAGVEAPSGETSREATGPATTLIVATADRVPPPGFGVDELTT